MRVVLVALLLTALALAAVAIAPDYTTIDKLLQSHIADRTFPGATYLIRNMNGIIMQGNVGNFVYAGDAPPPHSGGVNQPMDVDTTLFDLASVTKIVATTAATAILVDQGYLQLNETVASDRLLGPAFAANGKGSISVLNLLVHNAGFPADPNPNYYAPDFGCPPSGQNPPTPVTTCRDKIYGSLMQQPLDAEPNTQYVYSDLSFISLMFVVGRVVSAEGLISPTDLRSDCPTATAPQTYICNFEAFVRVRVFEYLSMKQTTFQPPSVDWPRCAPAENDTYYEKAVIQGYVSDGNAFALGGISGHAGAFGTAGDVALLAAAFLFPDDMEKPLIRNTTAQLFMTEFNHSQSSRALGWNTNDPAVFDEGWNMTCGNMSSRTVMHTGYTGTMICADPDRKIISILMTNRVYPTDAPGHLPIESARREFNNAVLDLIEYRPAAVKAPLFWQCNHTWAENKMQNDTICNVGCLMSSCAMALAARSIQLPFFCQMADANPGTLNAWLRMHKGYVNWNNLDEDALNQIQGVKYVGPFKRDEISHSQLQTWLLDATRVVIANVLHGRHFVLVQGWNPVDIDQLWVNDPGFNTTSYSYSKDVVGWRVFTMQPQLRL